MKKRIAGLVCLLLVFTMFLTGCSLFPQNKDRYYAQVVATVDNDISITKEDLLIAYNQYASTYVNQYGYTQDETIDAIINLLINQEVMLREAKKLFTLTDLEKNKIWYDTYDTINSTLKSYEEEIIVADGGEVDSEEEEAQREEMAIYEKQAELCQAEDGSWYIVALDEEEDYSSIPTVEGGADKFRTYQEISTEDVSSRALKKYIKALKTGEEGRTFEGDNAYSDDAVLKRGVERVYEYVEKNFYFTKLKSYLVKNTNVTVDGVLAKYRDLLLEDYATYKLNPSQYVTDMSSSQAEVFYYLDEYSDEFYFVSHFLIKYSEEQTAQIADLDTQLSDGYITEVERDAQVALITSQIKGTKYVDGIATDEVYSASDILNSLNNELDGKTYAEKCEIFRKYISWYNEDDTFNTAATPYSDSHNNTKMDLGFNAASKALDDNGVVGAISGLTKSTYGYHILFYCGRPTNLFTISDPNNFELSNADVVKLDSALYNPHTQKTLFDLMYEKVLKDNYSTFETAYLQQLKQDVDIKIYKKAYKDLMSE